MSIRLAEANRAIQAALAKAHDLAVKYAWQSVTPMAVPLPSSVWTARLLKLIVHHMERR